MSEFTFENGRFVIDYTIAHIEDIVVGNFNGDQYQDIFLVGLIGEGEVTTPVKVFTGNPDGSFTDSTSDLFGGTVPETVYAARILGADFNNDGFTDIFVPEYGRHDLNTGGTNRLFLSNGTGYDDKSSTLPQDVSVSHGGSFGDIDNDGDLDILVNNLNSSTNDAVQLLINDGQGNFTKSDNTPAEFKGQNNGGHTWSTLTDVDGDGYRDMILGAWDATPETSLFLNDGTGDFSNSTKLTLPLPSFQFASALDMEEIDLNGDNLIDLVISYTNGGNTQSTTYYSTNHLQFLENKGNGVFEDVTSTRLLDQLTQDGSWTKYIDVVDFNNDGFKDIVTSSSGVGTTNYVYQNNTDGTFSLVDQLDAIATVVRPIQLDSDANLEYLYTNFAGVFAVENTFTALPNSVEDGVYRFFNSSTGTHFYTNNLVERNNVINNLDNFNYEGASFKAVEANAQNAVGVHRFYNSETGTHFYTASEAERDQVQSNLPQFNYEGVSYYGYGVETAGSQGLHRFFNTETGVHFYTASDAEQAQVEATLPQFNYEGIVYWVDGI